MRAPARATSIFDVLERLLTHPAWASGEVRLTQRAPGLRLLDGPLRSHASTDFETENDPLRTSLADSPAPKLTSASAQMTPP